MGNKKSLEVPAIDRPMQLGLDEKMGNEKTLELPAIGRPMQLGMLYDCRDDTPLTGSTLWDPDVLKKNRYVRTQQETRFNILDSDSINDKSTALNVESSLKASLLGGVIECKGSAEFITDKKTTSRQFRLTLHCKTTVRYEQLTMKHLSRSNVHSPQVIEHDKGTHVVTGILYGAQAFFVFDRYLNEDENEQQVRGRVTAIIKKITFNMEGKGDLKLTESEKEEADKLQCKFHGDFAPQSKPATFQEAVAIYTKLSSMLGKSGKFAVPLTVWLYPLSNLDSKAAKLVQEISTNAIDRFQDIFEGLDQWKIKCDDLERNSICTDFPKLKEKLDLSRQLVHGYKRSLQRNIAQALPKVRGGEAEVKILLDIISDYEQSPFNVRQLERWVKCREKEMSVLGAFMKGFESSRIIRFREDLNALLLDYSVKQIVVFSFSSVGLEDEYLKALSRHIGTQTAVPYSPRSEWFESAETLMNMKMKAKQFIEFATANKESEQTTFGVMGFVDGEEAAVDGGSIFLYQEGLPTIKDFQPPGAPGQPEILTISHDSVFLRWAEPQIVRLSCVKATRVQYREDSHSGDPGWSEYRVKDANMSATIPNLRPNTTYEFSVVASCEFGESQASPIINATTFPSSPPHDIRRASITVAWDKPRAIADGLNVSKYIVKSMPVGDNNPDHVLMNETEGSGCLCHIENMEPNKKYSVSVSARFETAGDSEFSRPVEITATPAINQRSMNINDFIARCDIVRRGNHSKGERSVYRLPLTKGKQEGNGKYQTYCFGEATDPGIQHLVIMVVGATGAGKSTLINGMINYIFNVEWDDNFRFKIIADDGENKNKSQTQSQTQLITAYTINPTTWSHLESKLTIIDTPGFGDTRGIGQDKVIVGQIRDFFTDSSMHQIDHIDVIGFVAQATQARLTPTQRYVFDSVLAIFGKDIEQNISLLATFADGHKLPVLDAIKEANIPISNNIFKFNNAELYANKPKASKCTPGYTSRESRHGAYRRAEEKDTGFGNLFWKMGTESMRDFFSAVKEFKPISLTLTQEVLAERERLEVAVEGLQPQIQMGCCKLDELQEEHRILEQYEAEIEGNKDFSYKVEVQRSRKVDVPCGRLITNCSRCHFTCHYPCHIADDTKKYKCKAMNKSTGECNVCPGKCDWNVHFNQAYKFEFYTKKETRKYSELESRYNDATGKKLTVEEVVKKHQEEFVSVQECVFQLITESHRSLKRLEEIALRPNPLSTMDYVDLLIQGEEREAKPGWKARVHALHEVRKGTEIMSQIKQADFNPFKKYEESFVGKGKKTKGLFGAFCTYISDRVHTLTN